MTTRGDRLRSYLLAKTGGRSGWQAELVAASGVKRQTISKYTSATFDRYPDLGTLATLAAALNVETFELVAAMDGETPAMRLDDRFREAVRSEVEAVLDERLGPRRGRPAQPGAA